jgi:hypothetical protein
MTELEREWRRLSRADADAGMMDLWARIAPPSWIDRKRWRDADLAAQLDVAIALAADVDGVEAAEAAVDALRLALAAWETPIGSRIRWQPLQPPEPLQHDFDGTVALLAEPLRAAREALSARGALTVVVARAQQLEQEVHEAARARFADRPALARGLAHAAFVDAVSHAASLAGRRSPVTSLRDLWRSGYVLSAIDSRAVTLELPPL